MTDAKKRVGRITQFRDDDGNAYTEFVSEPAPSVPTSPPAPRDEVGWLIEYTSATGHPPTYWAGKKDFTFNHLEAVRFARKEDAERVMRTNGQMMFDPKNLHATEHMWCSRSTDNERND